MNTSAAALFALRAFRSSSSPIKSNSGSNPWTVRTFATTTKQKKVAAKPTSTGSGSKSSSGAGGAKGTASSATTIEPKNIDPPPNVFKQVDKSALGPGASKEGEYKNPEYFCYHNMSYTDMELVMAKFRVPQPSNQKRNI